MTATTPPRYLTRPGTYGTLHLYAVRYTSDGPGYDSDCPEMTMSKWAYSLDHVLDWFAESDSGEGWRMLAVALVPADCGAHRMSWHRV